MACFGVLEFVLLPLLEDLRHHAGSLVRLALSVIEALKLRFKLCAPLGNPFNQPGVESYKKNMFALLGKPGYEGLTAELEAKLK